MTTSRRLVSLLLLVAVASSSVEVLFGDRHAEDGAAAAQALDSPEFVMPGGMTVVAAPSDSEAPLDDCPCLCACVCAGAQLVVVATVNVFHVATDGGTLPMVETPRSIALHARRPPFRPPLA